MYRKIFALLTFLLAVAVAPGVQAATPESSLSPGDHTAIQAVINNQIRALQADDAEAAFALSAPDVRRQFGTAEAFAGMIREDYEPLLRHYSRVFLAIAIEDEEVIQPVRFVNRDGTVVVGLFGMERQPDGEWKVYGCQLKPTTLHAA